MSFFAIVFTLFYNSDIILLNAIMGQRRRSIFVQDRNESLETAISTTREKMIRHAENNGFLDEGTLDLSRQLDRLILEQIRMKYSLSIVK